MSHALRHLGRASRLLPATLASLVSLFALAPAETMINRLLHQFPPHATPNATEPEQAEPPAAQHVFHDERVFWLNRYAYKPPSPDEQPTCAEPTCFDPESFAPAAGSPQQPDHADQTQDADAYGSEPPAKPSEEPVEIAGLDSFAPDHGAKDPGGVGGNGGNGGSGGAGGAGPSGGDGGSGGTPFDYVLLPGSGVMGNGGNGGDGGIGSIGGDGGTGGTSGFGNRPGGGRDGTGGAGGAGGALGGNGGDGGDGGTQEEGDLETLGLRVAPAAGAIEVTSPASLALLGAAIGILALRRRRARD